MIKFGIMKDFRIVVALSMILVLIGVVFSGGFKFVKTNDTTYSKNTETPLPEQYSPRFSEDTGFYKDPFYLNITCPAKGAKIYYTLDGSIPTAESTLYESPLPITDHTTYPNVLSAIGGVCPEGDYIPQEPVLKGIVIRAIAILPDGSKSKVTNGTYFVGIDRESAIGELPVISMYADPQDLFSHERGIYVLGKIYEDHMMKTEQTEAEQTETDEYVGNCFNRGRAWERPAAIDYIPFNKREKGFSTDLGIRIMGGTSRVYMQKSFRLKCRSEYGQKNTYYNLLDGGQARYKSFILRNGGNDYDYARFRDPMLQELVKDRAFETQSSKPVVLFIDGEYWGVYAMTEDYDGHYIENSGYGVKAENVVIVKNGEIDEGTAEDMKLFTDMFDYISKEDMSNETNYAKASEMLDMQSFADYCAFNIYICNGDSFFINDNNWRMWRAREAGEGTGKNDGKWRMMVFDTDYSTGIYENGKDYEDTMMLDILEGVSEDTGCVMLRALMKNESFKAMFIKSLHEMRDICFDKERVNEALGRYLSEYEKPVCDTYRRFGPEDRLWGDPAEYYRMRVGELAEWLNGRYEVFDDQIKQIETPKSP